MQSGKTQDITYFGNYLPENKTELNINKYLSMVKRKIGVNRPYNDNIEEIILNLYNIDEYYYALYREFFQKVHYDKIFNLAPYIKNLTTNAKDLMKTAIIIKMRIDADVCEDHSLKPIKDYFDTIKNGQITFKTIDKIIDELYKRGIKASQKAGKEFRMKYPDFETQELKENYERIYKQIPYNIKKYIDDEIDRTIRKNANDLVSCMRENYVKRKTTKKNIFKKY